MKILFHKHQIMIYLRHLIPNMNNRRSSIFKQAVNFWNETTINALNLPIDNNLQSDIQNRLKNIFFLGDMYHFVFDIKNVRFDSMSNSITRILGFSSNISVQEFLERIHPDDQPYFMAFEQKYSEFLFSIDPINMGNYKSRYDFRVKNADNQYVRILHQLMIIQLDVNNNPIRSLAIHQDITTLKPNGIPVFSIIGNNGYPSYHNIQIDIPVPKAKKIVTRRETEVLKLIAEGFTSNDIAENLSISRHTVDSHRKNLLRKTASSNTLELISKAIIEGWI